MSKFSMMAGRVLAVAATILVLTPSAGYAHSLVGDHDPDRPLIDYLTLGFGHMVGGWDHLLFIAGVVLLAGTLRSAAKLISVFVVGHSLTLLIATLAGWKLNATAVDVVIALSLVYVGVQGIRGRPENFRLFGAVVFVFGLIHGLGLSTRLQALGLPEDGLVARVVLFNVGVELGQLVALGIIVGLGTLIVRALRPRSNDARIAYGALAATGLAAAAVLGISAADTEPEDSAVARDKPAQVAQSSSCTRQDSQPPRFIGGGHPKKYYFGPTETAPVEDLVHVIGDGLVIVRYSPNLAVDEHKAIEAFVTNSNPPYVIAAPDPDQTEPVKAIAAYRTLTCEKLAVNELTSFRDEWLAELKTLQRQR